MTVITCAPNHPRGILYPGYKNRLFQREVQDGINVLRVKTYLSANKGIKKRILNYVSYMISATMLCFLIRRVDIVVSTSPQFFCGMAGYFVSRLKRSPWVLEIRDLWPESIIAVGALTSGPIIRFLEGIETFIYRKADHIIALTKAFKAHVMDRGVLESNISVIPNGADLDRFIPLPMNNDFRNEYKLRDKSVVSYIGTHGMAHELGTILQAADLLRNRRDIVFLLVGDGAERDNLLQQRDAMKLHNVIMLPQQPKDLIPQIISASNACMVLLKNNRVFRTVIPSKIFEAMAMSRPIILGVRGESQAIIEKADCGICIEPENKEELARAVERLADSDGMSARLGENGLRFVRKFYNREKLAMKYQSVLQAVLQNTSWRL